ncbi:hypothetical protein RchiOBHm_Chr2g0175801 [Rosa chinensis]|uniref:Uncharacterized protein n=2 Tax=Rosa TaxID=3764 RepID=A0A2P6S6I6_ROSCH|nr:uncharacterized protein LOC112187148 [Rosa chinensis]PRQ54284.1 hypothetical protein RchiOBHm_Chr2g0175801 [Rosa chinensis]
MPLLCSYSSAEQSKELADQTERTSFRMKDYAALLIASALFAFLSPGLVFQMPGKERPFAFMNMKTSVASMFLHTVIYGLLMILFLVVLDIHIYA